MVDIATLGIKVDSSGATKGSADLDKLSGSAQGATKSVDQLTAATQKQAAAGQNNASRIAQQVSQNATLASSVEKAAVAHDGLAHNVHAAETALRLTGLASVAHAAGMGNISGSTVRAAESFGQMEFKASQLRTGLRVLNPVVNEVGGSLGNLRLLAGAGRAGLEILAVVISSVVAIALEKAAESARVLQQRLGELGGGGVKEGAKAFDEINKAAKAAGVSTDDFAASMETLRKSQRELLSEKGFRLAPGTTVDSFLGFSPKDAARALQTMSELLQVDGLNASKAKSAMDEFFSSIAKGGGLTKDIFDKLETASPRAAQALSQAFGLVNVESFRNRLDQVPVSLDKIIRSLGKLGPATDEEFKKMPQTVEQGLDHLKAEFERLMEDIGHSAGVTFASTFISGARTLVKGEWNWADLLKIGDAADKAMADFSAFMVNKMRNLFAEIKRMWDEFWSTLSIDKIGAAAKSARDFLFGQGDQSSSLTNRPLQDLGNREETNRILDEFVRGAKEIPPALNATDMALNKLTQDIVADAAKITEAANAAAAAAAAAKSGGIGSDYGASTGITAGETDLGSNATGGIYRMAGSGPDDTIKIRGVVSPGETIAIIPEGKMSGSLLAQLQKTVGTSPIDLSSGGYAITAPASYTDQEARRGELAFNITAAQQAAARAKIAANVLATSGATSAALLVPANPFAQPAVTSVQSSFKKTSPSLWSDKAGNAQFVDAPLTDRIGPRDASKIGFKPARPAEFIKGSAPFEGKGIITPDTPFEGKGIKLATALSDLMEMVGPSAWDEIVKMLGNDTGNIWDMVGPSFADAFSQEQPASFADRFSPFDNAAAPTFDEMWGGDAFSGGSGWESSGGGIGSDFAAGGGTDFYPGDFARGGSFTVPNVGRGGQDGVRTRMNLTPGEQVAITPNEERIGGERKSNSGGTHIENVVIMTQGQNPMASLSRNAIRRELSAWTRG